MGSAAPNLRKASLRAPTGTHRMDETDVMGDPDDMIEGEDVDQDMDA